jgi:hypothetical protein
MPCLVVRSWLRLGKFPVNTHCPSNHPAYCHNHGLESEFGCHRHFGDHHGDKLRRKAGYQHGEV